jgi:hypothetical protein
MFSAYRIRTRRPLAAAAVAVVALGILLGVSPAGAGAQDGCENDPLPTWYVRADLTDATGLPSGQFADERCPGRTLKASLDNGFHYILHTGFAEPGEVYTATYTHPDHGRQVRRDTATAGPDGRLRFELVDLACVMKRGQRLEVRVEYVDPDSDTDGVANFPTAVEYAVMLA